MPDTLDRLKSILGEVSDLHRAGAVLDWDQETYMPPGGVPGTRPGVTIASQFTGMAMWSVILGALAVGVPILTLLTTGGHIVYFYVIPIFGFIRGIQAVTRGQVIGGVVGIVLNILGGLISLIASGVLFR